MMFAYEFDRLNTFLRGVLQKNLSSDAWKWLEQEGQSVRAKGGISRFNIAFVAMPRKTGKNVVNLSKQDEEKLKGLRTSKGFQHRSVDCRSPFKGLVADAIRSGG
jgi:hypothetical protein